MNRAARKRYLSGIRRTRGRGFTITENENEKRITFTFDQGADYNTSELLFSVGFRRDRSRLGWTRYLNDDGRRAAEFVAGKLNTTPREGVAPG